LESQGRAGGVGVTRTAHVRVAGPWRGRRSQEVGAGVAVAEAGGELAAGVDHRGPRPLAVHQPVGHEVPLVVPPPCVVQWRRRPRLELLLGVPQALRLVDVHQLVRPVLSVVLLDALADLGALLQVAATGTSTACSVDRSRRGTRTFGSFARSRLLFPPFLFFLLFLPFLAFAFRVFLWLLCRREAPRLLPRSSLEEEEEEDEEEEEEEALTAFRRDFLGPPRGSSGARAAAAGSYPLKGSTLQNSRRRSLGVELLRTYPRVPVPAAGLAQRRSCRKRVVSWNLTPTSVMPSSDSVSPLSSSSIKKARWAAESGNRRRMSARISAGGVSAADAAIAWPFQPPEKKCWNRNSRKMMKSPMD